MPPSQLCPELQPAVFLILGRRERVEECPKSILCLPRQVLVVFLAAIVTPSVECGAWGKESRWDDERWRRVNA